MNIIYVLLLILAGACAFTRVYKQENITLGSLLSLHKETGTTGCNRFYLPGLNRVEATIYTIQKINNNSELLPNVSLGYDIRDYCDDRALTMKETYDFAINSFSGFNSLAEYPTMTKGLCSQCMQHRRNHSDSVVAIVGPYGSRNSLQVAGLLQVVGIAGISPSATSEELSWPFYNNFFRTVPPDGLQAKAMADLIDHFDWQYVAAVAVEHSYGLYGIRALEREAVQRKTFCIGFSEYIPPTNYHNQLPGIVAKLKHAKNVMVVILWIADSAAKALMREAARQNIKYRVWILSDSLATKTPDFLGSDFIYLGVYLGIQPQQFRDKDYENYLRELTPKKSLQNGNMFWQKLWREEFNCSALLNDSQSGSCPENLTITTTVFNKMYDDFIPYHVDAIYAVANALDKLYHCKYPNGLLDKGKCPPTSPAIRPEHVLLYLRNVSFQGLTGLVQFDESGDPLSSSYDIISFQRSEASDILYSKVKVGSWVRNRKQSLHVFNDTIAWNLRSGVPKSVCKKTCPPGTMQTETVACCWECVHCPDGSITWSYGASNCTRCTPMQKSNDGRTLCTDLPVVALEWTDATSIVFVAAAIAAFVFCGFAFSVFVRYRHTPIVKASNRELCFVILITIAGCIILAFLIITRPSDAICSLIEPWRYLTLTICVSVLFLKTMRILRAFEATAMFQWVNQHCIFNTRRQFLVVILINIPQVIFASLWKLLDQPSLKMEIIVKHSILLSCQQHRTTVGLALHMSMVAYLVFWSAICTFYAFKARNLPENFNEAKYIGFSMYILLLSWITYLPVQSTVDGLYVSVVSCATLLVSSYGFLLCIFAPKLYVILRHPDQNTTDFVRAELRTQMSNQVGPTKQRSRIATES